MLLMKSEPKPKCLRVVKRQDQATLLNVFLASIDSRMAGWLGLVGGMVFLQKVEQSAYFLGNASL